VTSAPTTASAAHLHIVAVTACPTGVAHTYMSAEALAKVARLRGYTIDVEKQGAIGVRDALTDDSIRRADLVLIAADIAVDLSRFTGKPIHRTTTGHAIRDTASVLDQAVAGLSPTARMAATLPRLRRTLAGHLAEPYRHLLTGVAFAVPLVVAGGLMRAFAGLAGPEMLNLPVGLAEILGLVGTAAFGLFVPVLAGYIAHSIAGRPGLAPGLIGGLLAGELGGGFLGGIVAGLLAGYFVRGLDRLIRLPARFDQLMPTLIVPLLSALVVGLAVVVAVAGPGQALMSALTGWVEGLTIVPAAVLGALLGAMVATDFGGPVNKAAYTLAVGLLAAHADGPMAAVMAAGVSAPLGIALAVILFPSRFDADERRAAPLTVLLGLAFITEGALPFATRDPARVMPAVVAGSALTGAAALAAGCTVGIPLGGVFAMVLPEVAGRPEVLLAVIAAGAAATAGLLLVLKSIGRRGNIPR
jgi:fructose PTS system EIIBC or EIIC component